MGGCCRDVFFSFCKGVVQIAEIERNGVPPFFSCCDAGGEDEVSRKGVDHNIPSHKKRHAKRLTNGIGKQKWHHTMVMVKPKYIQDDENCHVTIILVLIWNTCR